MHFGSVEYACLLIAAMALTWFFRSKPFYRSFALLWLSFLFFYRSNNGYFLGARENTAWALVELFSTCFGLLLLSATVDFHIGRLLGSNENPKKRGQLLAFSVILNLGILATFKYFNFFAEQLTVIMGSKTGPTSSLLAPIGLSFYTFQTISYVVDVYRKKTEPAKRFLDYLLYLAFFPQLLMGPIVRAHVLLPQLKNRPTLTAEKGSEAVFRIGIGLVKKLAIADFLRSQIVDPVFSNPEMYSSLETLTAVYAYTFQIYADFSGYTDIAIGSALLLGIEIPENFRAPYLATNLREFWQRWHITLSTWLRDYLYIPMGGSRRSTSRTYLNLMITMILGGLWHGPALKFAVWGMIHGAALVATRAIQRSTLIKPIPDKVRKWVGLFLTFHVVAAAWIFFRARSFDAASKIYESLFAFDFGVENIRWTVVAVLIVAAVSHITPIKWLQHVQLGFHKLPAPVQASTFLAAVYLAQKIAVTDVAPFIYSNF